VARFDGVQELLCLTRAARAIVTPICDAEPAIMVLELSYQHVIILAQMDRDPGLDVLLDLDGEVFAIDAEGKYLVRFVVRQVPRSQERPQGLNYSLTLHDEIGARLVGFDNAHPAPKSKVRRRRMTQDHRHRLRTIRPYEYRDAATLLADFWAEVDAVLRERGVLP
jgi:hypothetical protein